MNKLRTVILDRLQELEKTQTWLAIECDVSNAAVTKWLTTGQISLASAIAVSKALDITISRLVGEDEGRDQKIAEQSVENALLHAVDMVETYRLAGPDHRRRIDLALKNARESLSYADKAKSRLS